MRALPRSNRTADCELANSRESSRSTAAARMRERIPALLRCRPVRAARCAARSSRHRYRCQRKSGSFTGSPKLAELHPRGIQHHWHRHRRPRAAPPRNVAFSAITAMCPPVTFSRARRSKSKPLRRGRRGKCALPDGAVRSGTPGNGKSHHETQAAEKRLVQRGLHVSRQDRQATE